MKWFGEIAFSNQEETDVDVWEDKPIVRQYYGDLNKNYKSDQLADNINSTVSVTNTLSVVADPFLLESFHKILYVTFMGQKWRVSNVEVGYPRLTLNFGSLYLEEATQ